MYQLPNEKRAQILSLLCEGMGINATTRITGVSKHTVRKLLANARKHVHSTKTKPCVT